MNTKEERDLQILTDLACGTERNKINVYTCETCGNSIVTVDREHGVTSMTLKCRAVSTCKGRMFSCMYRVPQHLKPTWEWYKPVEGSEEYFILDEHQRRHVRDGGLMLRKISTNPEEVATPDKEAIKRMGVLKVAGWRKGKR